MDVTEVLALAVKSIKEQKLNRYFITGQTVNRRVENGLPLLSLYFKSCDRLSEDHVMAFIDHGCDLNAQDEYGRTPFHWLVVHNSMVRRDVYNKMAVIELCLSNGADPRVVDNDGNNALLLAIIYDSQREVIVTLTTVPVDSIIEHKNNAGYDALALYFRTRSPRLFEDRYALIEIIQYARNVDKDGNTCLHDLFAESLEVYQPTVQYKSGYMSGKRSNNAARANIVRNCTRSFMVSLTRLIELGANITHKNNDDLIPLQVALQGDAIMTNIDGENYSELGLRDLACLVPDEEDILAQLVPKDTSNDCNSLAAKVWFVARLTKYGLDYTEDNVIGICLSTYYCDKYLLKSLIENGAIPHLEDLTLAFRQQNWSLLNVLYQVVTKENIMDIVHTFPDLMVKLITSNSDTTLFKRRLFEQGYPFKTEFLAAAIYRPYGQGQFMPDFDTLTNIYKFASPGLRMQLNESNPNVFEQLMPVIKILKDDYIVLTRIEELFKHGMLVTAYQFKEPFELEHLDLIMVMLKYANDKVKGQLGHAIPGLIVTLCRLLSNEMEPGFPRYSPALYRTKCNMYTDCLTELVKSGLTVNLDDLGRCLDHKQPFAISLLLGHIDIGLKAQIKTSHPNILVRVLSYLRYANYSTWLTEMVANLLNKFEVDVNYSDCSYEHILQDLIEYSDYNSDVALRILDIVLQRDDLNLNATFKVKTDYDEVCTELRAIQYAIFKGSFEIVNKLLIAGAQCEGIVFRGNEDLPRCVYTIQLLHTLGFPINITTPDYKVLMDQLNEWIETEAKRMKSLKELAAVAVHQNTKRNEINHLIATINLRPEVVDMLRLKHVIEVKVPIN